MLSFCKLGNRIDLNNIFNDIYYNMSSFAGKWHPSMCSADEVLRSLQAIIHFCLEYPATQIAGFSFIFDNYLASLDTLHLFLKYATVLAPTIVSEFSSFHLNI